MNDEHQNLQEEADAGHSSMVDWRCSVLSAEYEALDVVVQMTEGLFAQLEAISLTLKMACRQPPDIADAAAEARGHIEDLRSGIRERLQWFEDASSDEFEYYRDYGKMPGGGST